MITRQEIFNKAYLGLKSQNFQRSMTDDGSCLYVGGPRFHCAIGWLFADNPLIPISELRDYESYTINDISKRDLFDRAGIAITSDVPRSFLEDLQDCHDTYPTVCQGILSLNERQFGNSEDLQLNLMEFADWYGLTIPK